MRGATRQQLLSIPGDPCPELEAVQDGTRRVLSMQGGWRKAVWRIWTEAVPARWRSVTPAPLAIGLGPCDLSQPWARRGSNVY